jgi:hypothetical protein
MPFDVDFHKLISVHSWSMTFTRLSNTIFSDVMLFL